METVTVLFSGSIKENIYWQPVFITIFRYVDEFYGNFHVINRITCNVATVLSFRCLLIYIRLFMLWNLPELIATLKQYTYFSEIWSLVTILQITFKSFRKIDVSAKKMLPLFLVFRFFGALYCGIEPYSSGSTEFFDCVIDHIASTSIVAFISTVVKINEWCLKIQQLSSRQLRKKVEIVHRNHRKLKKNISEWMAALLTDIWIILKVLTMLMRIDLYSKKNFNCFSKLKLELFLAA